MNNLIWRESERERERERDFLRNKGLETSYLFARTKKYYLFSPTNIYLHTTIMAIRNMRERDMGGEGEREREIALA